MNTIGERIKLAREKIGMTQVDMADKIGVSKQNLYKYERGLVTNIPSDKIELIGKLTGVSPAYLMGWSDTDDKHPQSAIDAGIATNKGAVRIPVLSEIAAGVPIEAMNYTLDDADPSTWEEIPSEWLHGDKQYFALRVSGDSMEPKIEDGTIAIIERCYEFIDNRIMAVYINGYNATLKRVRLKDNGMIVLEAFNPTYGAQIFTAEEVENLPVRPCGILRETRTAW